MSPASAPIRLAPLLCFKCRAPVRAGVDEVAWVCEQCGQGLLLDPAPAAGPTQATTRGLDVFFSQSVPQGRTGRPFWVSKGQVALTERATYKGDESRAAREFWSGPRLFCVPAWECALDEILAMGAEMLKNTPVMQPGGAVPFLPVVTAPGDLRALAEFIVVSLEAERRDYLKSLNYTLQLESPQLWILP